MPPSKIKKRSSEKKKSAHSLGRKKTVSAQSNPKRSKRKQIVQAAKSVFLQYGYSGASMAQVADTAGVIKATIYSHFKDKKQLFKAIIEDIVIDKAIDEMEAELSAMPLEGLVDFIAAKLDRRRKDPQFRALMRLIIGESGRFPELADLFLRTCTLPFNEMATRFLKKHPKLKVSDHEAAAQIIAGSLVYWVISQELLGAKKIHPIDLTRIQSMLKEIFARLTACDET